MQIRRNPIFRLKQSSSCFNIRLWKQFKSLARKFLYLPNCKTLLLFINIFVITIACCIF